MKIYLSLISLSAMLSSRRLCIADAPEFALDHGFQGIEILDRQLSEIDDEALGRLATKCGGLDCGVVVDAGCDLATPDPDARKVELAHLKRIVRRAEVLGSTVVRVAPGGQRLSIQKLIRAGGRRRGGSGGKKHALASSAWVRRIGYFYRSHGSNIARYREHDFANVIGALDRILPYAGARGISLAIENHWGISTRPEWILRMVRDTAYPNIGTCPDFGNFPSRSDRYAGLAQLSPAALHVQAKCWRFHTDGEERTIDFGRCIGILKAAGYDGPVAVEYEGGGNELAGCLSARQLILRSL